MRLAMAALALVTTAATAADYPARPVRMIVTFTPGGATDMIARTVAQKLADAWGQQFVVDNQIGRAHV